MKHIQAVIWDQGNVLDSHRESDKAVADALGLSFDDFKKYATPHIRSAHLGLDELEFLNRICVDAGREPIQERVILEIYATKRHFNDQLLFINRQLRTLGFKTAVLSNAEKPLVEFLKDKYVESASPNTKDVSHHYFHTLVYSCDVGLAKPDPEIYLLSCERLEITTKEAVFIDDSARNVEAFQKLGGYAIHHVENRKTIQELSEFLGYNFFRNTSAS